MAILACALVATPVAGAAKKPDPKKFVDVQVKGGKLRITGNSARNVYTLRLRRKNPKVLQIDVGNNGSADREVPRRRFKSIAISTLGGDDVIRIDERNGPFERSGKVTISGGNGNDTITGGRAAERIVGGNGRDSVDGNGGKDVVALGSGDDSFRWDAGDGPDKADGQSGTDRLALNGMHANETAALATHGARLAFLDAADRSPLDSGGFESVALNVRGGTDAVTVHNLAGTGVTRLALDLGAGDNQPDQVVVEGTPGDDTVAVNSAGLTGLAVPIALANAGATERVIVDLLDGADKADASGLAAGAFGLALNGGEKDDTLTGGAGNDAIDAGPGNDTVTGNGGDDSVTLGDGDDVFTWTGADGSDAVAGQGGADRLVVNGTAGADPFALSADGARLRVARDTQFAVNADGIETVDVNGAGGADPLSISDLTGTGVVQANVDLGASDGQADALTVNGTAGNDNVAVNVGGVTGLVPAVAMASAEAGSDRLIVNTLDGDDKADASALPATAFAVTLDGGAGADALTGGPGADTLLGGEGADVLTGGDGGDAVSGGPGSDTAALGAGDDVFNWTVGDGSDSVEGQAGSADTLVVNGSDGADNVGLSPNAARLRVFSVADNAAIDSDDVEAVAVNEGGGADLLTVNDLTGTDVTQTDVDFGAADGQVDTVVANATAGNDSVTITGAGVVSGLATKIAIARPEAGSDRLTVNALNGTDTVDASAVPAGAFALTLNGGPLADVLIGGAGDDLIVGAQGDDLALLGAGNDTFTWNPGDGSDTIEGQAGSADKLIFNGANINENIDLSANGARLRLTRDVAAITMDVNDVEVVDVNASGGTDTITVHDLSATDVTKVNIDNP